MRFLQLEDAAVGGQVEAQRYGKRCKEQLGDHARVGNDRFAIGGGETQPRREADGCGQSGPDNYDGKYHNGHQGHTLKELLQLQPSLVCTSHSDTPQRYWLNIYKFIVAENRRLTTGNFVQNVA